jgi:hypothetical protein
MSGGVLASGSRCSACWVGMSAAPAMTRQIARKRGADFEWAGADHLSSTHGADDDRRLAIALSLREFGGGRRCGRAAASCRNSMRGCPVCAPNRLRVRRVRRSANHPLGSTSCHRRRVSSRSTSASHAGDRGSERAAFAVRVSAVSATRAGSARGTGDRRLGCDLHRPDAAR